MYSSHNYTGPGWNNSAPPPPVNASNLQDISNALEDLNITQEQLEQLGVSGTLGDILTGNKLYQYAYFRYGLIGEPVISNITAQPNWNYGDPTATTFVYGDGYNIDPVTHIATLINQQTEIIYYNNFPQIGHLSGKYIIHKRSNGDAVGVPCLINSNSSYSTTKVGNYVILNVTNCTQYNYTNVSLGEAEVFMSPTDTYPHDGINGDYYYLYIGQPFENALYAKTTFMYAGTGQGTLTLHIPYDFNYIEWVWCSNNTINQKMPAWAKLTKRSDVIYVENTSNNVGNINVSINGNDITITNPSSTNLIGTTVNFSNVKYVLAIY